MEPYGVDCDDLANRLTTLLENGSKAELNGHVSIPDSVDDNGEYNEDDELAPLFVPPVYDDRERRSSMPLSNLSRQGSYASSFADTPNYHYSRRPSLRRVSLSGQKKSFLVLNYGKDANPCQLSRQSSFTSTLATPPLSPLLPTDRPKLFRLGSYDSFGQQDKVGHCSINIPDESSVVYNTPSAKLQRTLSLVQPTRIYPHKHTYNDPWQQQQIDNKNDQVISSISSWTKKLAIQKIARFGRLFAKRKQDRIINKNGDLNLTNTNVEKRNIKYMIDIFTTLLELRWRYTLLLVILTFLASWVFFALLWWAIAVIQSKNASLIEDTNPCVVGVYDFPSAILFSIETQQTIGYGTRAITTECPGAVVLVMIQSVVGLLIQCILTGLIFAKLARPKRRAETILFTKTAVVTVHNNQQCLMFRVADMRKHHIIGVQVNAFMIDEVGDDIDGGLQSRQRKMKVITELDDIFFMAWPIKVLHPIDENSPLWQLSEEELLQQNFEIVIVLEGTNEMTGMAIQKRTSYLPGEIQWGQTFCPMVNRKGAKYTIDYTMFDKREPIDMSIDFDSISNHQSQHGILHTKDIPRRNSHSRVHFSDTEDEQVV